VARLQIIVYRKRSLNAVQIGIRKVKLSFTDFHGSDVTGVTHCPILESALGNIILFGWEGFSTRKGKNKESKYLLVCDFPDDGPQLNVV
jgi:hypothetical protein